MAEEPPKRARQRADALLNETASDADEPGLGARKKPKPAPPESDEDAGAERTRKFQALKPEPPPPAEEEENPDIMKTSKLEPYRPSEPKPQPLPAQEPKKTGRFKTGPAINRELSSRSSESTREVSREETEAYGLEQTAWFTPRSKAEEEEAEPEPPAEDDRQRTARFVPLPRVEEPASELPPPPPSEPEPVPEAPPAEDERQRTARFVPVAKVEEPAEPEPAPEPEAPAEPEPEPPAAVAPTEPEAPPSPPIEDERQRTARFVPLAKAEPEAEPEPPESLAEPEPEPLPPRDEDLGERTARYVPHAAKPEPPPPADDDRQKTARFAAAIPDPSLQEISGEKTARFVPPPQPAQDDDRQKTARFVARPSQPAADDDERKKTARINLGDLSQDERERISKAREEYLSAAAKKLEQRRKAAARGGQAEPEEPLDEGRTSLNPLPKHPGGAALRDASSMIEAAEQEPPPVFYSEAPLQGEAPDEAAEKPVRLTREAAPDTVDMAAGEEIEKPKRRIGAKTAWSLGGALLGAAAGLSLHFIAGMTLPFIESRPRAAFEDRRVEFHTPEGAKDPWIRRGSFYASVGEKKLHLFDSASEKFAGALELPETAGKPEEAALIGLAGGTALGDLTLAWPDAGSLRWKRVESTDAEAETPLIEKPSSGSVELTAGSVGRFAPVAIEDWGRSKTERLLAAERRKDTKEDALRVVDPVTRETSEAAFALGGRLLGAPVAFYDSALAGSFAMAISSAEGKASVRLLKISGLKIEEAGEPIAMPWPGNCPVVVARARFGAERGWVVAQRGAVAGLAYAGGKLQLRGSAGTAPEGGDESEPPPIVATFPNGASPTHDCALVIDASDEGDLASGSVFAFSPQGAAVAARLEQLPSPSDGAAACDFNGDGHWDVVALNKRSQNGAAWLLDGKTLKAEKLAGAAPSKGDKAPPVQSRIAWSIAPDGSGGRGRLAAFFMSKESIGGGEAATIAIKRSFGVSGRGWKWLERDFAWRNGDTPFLGGAPAGE